MGDVLVEFSQVMSSVSLGKPFVVAVFIGVLYGIIC